MKKVLFSETKTILQLIRVKQWIKNFFLFAPLIFSHHLFEATYVSVAIRAFFAFCFLSSVVYIINDIADLEQDKNHPVKKQRPLPSGRITKANAIIISFILFTGMILLAHEMNFKFKFALFVYFIINILYSFKLKQIVLLDIFFIAFGFMIRIIAGAWAIDVYISSWLILTTLFLSLFLAVTKRRSELSVVENSSTTRKVLGDYSIVFADQMATISAAGTVIAYALYTVSERTREIFQTENLIFTTPFVVYGIFRYLYLVHKKNLGENPTQIITTDLPMIINIFLWVITSIGIIYKYKFNVSVWKYIEQLF
ncbi:MAG: decaprenyl-phosphate phosphoribosyltransferase [Ignavibacteria bacterium]|nr:decaprenyl-phosphate phosphoribosyltransferase [Ignavibacteria bacterium]